MQENKLKEIEKLIDEKKIDKAQLLLSQLGNEYNRNANYLFLRGKVFYLNKLYYIALDTLLIALEFEQSDKIYNMLAEIYGEIGNQKLKNKLLDKDLRFEAINLLKDKLTGIYRK